jgi:transcriptional regulator of arginine metabolism
MSKVARQSVIRSVIQQKPILSQDELRKVLRKNGFEVTQATLSRDVHELGLGKGPEGYFLPSGPEHNGAVGPSINVVLRSFVTNVKHAQNLLVVKTVSGSAQPVAVALDQEQWPEVVGTIGGDDTVLVVCTDPASAIRVKKRTLEQIS